MDKKVYDIKSAKSIIQYAKKLKGKSLRNSCNITASDYKIEDKGGYGKLVEKYYFKYEPNSNKEPDFLEAGLELKCTPLKLLKNGEYRSKERLVMNIIDYLNVHKEEFENSSFWNKNSHLLLIFYLHNNEQDLLDYIIKLVGNWEYPDSDLKVIRNDWEKIKQKIKDGCAHELSEGDTFYLGACTKGSTAAKSLRIQPFNKKKAKQRAYSLKQGYVNHIIANIANTVKEDPAIYGKIIKKEPIKELNLEEIVISKFKPFYGKTSHEIEQHFNLNLNFRAKNYYASLTKAILGIELNKKIEEFEKADIEVKTIRVEENNSIIQSISFPAFKFKDIYNEVWEESELYNLTEKKFLFLFFKKQNDEYIFDKARFWNMPFQDSLEVKKVWGKTKHLITTGTIFKDYKRNKKGEVMYSTKGNPIKLNNFPKISENKICHVRPHGADGTKTYSLPVKDLKLKTKEYSKQCFWLNASYVRDEIYLKYID